MNYHIMIQDKFIEGFIEDIHEIGQDSNNVFLIRESLGLNIYVNPERRVKYVENEFDSLKKEMQNIGINDIIFIHWYDDLIADIVYNMPNRVVVFFWGGEFYDMPIKYHKSWLFDKKTSYCFYNKNYNNIKNTFINKCFNYRIYNLLQLLSGLKVSIEEYNKKLKRVKRIDYLVLLEQADSECDLIKTLYPGCRFKKLNYFYDVNFEKAISLNSKKYVNGSINILVGNSATPTSNHLDAFSLLENLNANIYCPLSYGDNDYRDFIINEGKALFGSKFHYLSEILDRDSYIKYLNNVDIVYLFHNRSQAFGNIITAIALGKPVFLKKNNVLRKVLDNMGIKTYDVMDINKFNLSIIIHEEYNKRSSNINKMRHYLSKEKRLLDLHTTLSYFS